MHYNARFLFSLCFTNVCCSTKTCSEVLEALKSGYFGETGRRAVDDFKAWCHERMPNTTDFFSGEPVANHNHAAADVDAAANHVSNLSVEDGTR